MESFVLPFRGEQFSFGLTYKSSPEESVLFDLSCVVFDIHGAIQDTTHARKPSALDGAIVTHRAEPHQLPESLVPAAGNDVVHVLPKKMERESEVLVFVASAQRQPGKAYDLSCSSKLAFTVTYTDEEGATTVKEMDLKPSVPDVAAAAAGADLSSSMIVGTLYLDQPGWTFRSNLSLHPYDSFGLLIPEMKQTIVNIKKELGINLDASNRLTITDTEKLTPTRQFEDRSLDEMASYREAEPVAVKQLRIDVGWALWKTRNEEGEEEEPENTDVAWRLIFYNKEGEEVKAVGTEDAGDWDAGVKVGRDEPEEEEAAEEEPAPEEEEEKEEGEEGEEGEEKLPPPPPPPPKEDPYAFPQKDVVFINTAELPQEVKVGVLMISNYSGAGFEHVRVVRAKMWDTTDGDDKARPMADFAVSSRFGADAGVSQACLLKLYKEPQDGSYSMFQRSGAKDVAEFVARTEEVKKVLAEYLAANKQMREAKAKAEAAAEESGEEVTEEFRPFVWRFSAPGVVMAGESLEDAEHDIKNLLNFDGPLAAAAERTNPHARVQFANDDTYFGGYENDLKSGPGVYCFANGACYVGLYKAGKRDGRGLLIMPDGGTYEGEFAADKFDGLGQYRYPDGSVYTGSWKGGFKDGPGVYWDTERGSLRGSWSKGVLKGEATYDQPALRFTGNFVRGMPAGPGAYSICSHRTLDMPKFAACHIQDDVGPTLSMTCEYAIPPGTEAEPELDEEGNPIVDEDKPQLPSFPKYEGLGFRTEALPVEPGADISFPPEGLLVAIEKVPAFTAAVGLQQAVQG